jgi:integrase
VPARAVSCRVDSSQGYTLDDTGGCRASDIEHLRTSGLIRLVAPLDRGGQRTTVVALTDQGRQLLETHRAPDSESRQAFYHGLVKPRELAHDAQLYRAYLRTAERLEARGARVTRVVLDSELKRDCQRFLQAVEAGLGKVTWHQFRHIHSSLMSDLRVPVKIAQEQLRHASSGRAIPGVEAGPKRRLPRLRHPVAQRGNDALG